MNATALSILTALLSSGVLWTVLQWIMSRRARAIQHRKDQADVVKAEEDAEQRERDRDKLLADAQRTAQQTALESADRRYGWLYSDHEALRLDMREMKQAAGLIINAFDNFLLRLRPSADGASFSATVTGPELEIARDTIAAARDHLYR